MILSKIKIMVGALRKIDNKLYFEIPSYMSNLYSLKETQRYRISYKELRGHLILHLLIFLEDE
jgi:hypothetical protein